MTKKLLLSCLLTALCFAFGTQETKAQCQANFTMFVDSGLVFFTDQSGSFIDPVVAWQWDFGMGASSTEQNPVLTLPAGVYSPCLTITTASGCTAIACDTLFISGGGGPIVDSCMIAANFDMIQMGGAIDFQNTSSGNFTLWTWDFGDGNTSTAFSPSHQYNILGLFTVCLTIANDECTETYCMEVDASGLGGSCNVFISSNIDTLATVPVTGMFEAVATGGIAPYAYAWNIGGLAIGDFASTVSYTFDLPGVYDVCVEMTDAEGCVATDCTVIIVEEDPIGWDCQSNFTYGEVPGALGMLFTSISTGSGINSFFWDFGDGNTSTVQDPVHAFNTIGTFTVCLTVTATDGCVSTSCQNVVIGDGPLCTSNFNVTITDLSMSCFNMSTPLMGSEFVWSFGNGDISTEMNPTYNYDAAGTYDVCLTVLTNTAIDSCFAQTCQAVTVIDGGIEGNAILGEISLGDETMPIQFDATVFLVSVDTNPATGELSYTIVDSIVVVGLNTTTYSFDGMPFGSYLVMADVGSSSLGADAYLPTYHLDASSWLDATVVNFNAPDTLVDVNISMISIDGIDGLGTISGTIDDDAGKNGVEGVLVILYSEEGTPVAFTHTDANGNYSFDNIGFGTYQVHVEIMGLESDWATVVLDEENTSASIVDFDISTEGVHTTYATVGIEEDAFGFTFTLLQNPVTEKVLFELNMETNREVMLQLTDLQGKIILQQNNINLLGGQLQQLSLDVAHLPSGVYLLQVGNETGAKKVLKVVK